jgi:ubiquinone/menaquinone biosynthesis C-methylase UbiE
MTALEQWPARVRLCRREQPETEDQAWQRLAEWYDEWTRHNDYVARVLPRLLAHVNAESQVLEIGPGSGAFTLPLARAAQHLVALEPSPNMRCVLERKLQGAGITNVWVVPRAAEERLAELDGEFDLAFASHSLYNIGPIDQVMRDLVRLARRVVILMGTGETPAWQRALHLQFRGKLRAPFANFREFYPMLIEQGIYADVEILPTSFNYVYASEEAMLDWWQRQLGLDDTRRAELCAVLARIAGRRDDHIGVYSIARSALVWIERERNLVALGVENS